MDRWNDESKLINTLFRSMLDFNGVRFSNCTE